MGEFRTSIETQTQALLNWTKENDIAHLKIHVSPDHKINTRNQGQWIKPGWYRPNGKPLGFWYAIGDSWLKFTTNEMPSGVKNYIYAVEINYSRMFTPKSQEEAEQFAIQYSSNLKNSVARGQYKNHYTGKLHYTVIGLDNIRRNYPLMPDWQEVARHYDGIELDPNNVYVDWAREWSVPSGCVWKKRAIKSITLIAQYDPYRKQYVDPQQSRFAA